MPCCIHARLLVPRAPDLNPANQNELFTVYRYHAISAPVVTELRWDKCPRLTGPCCGGHNRVIRR